MGSEDVRMTLFACSFCENLSHNSRCAPLQRKTFLIHSSGRTSQSLAVALAHKQVPAISLAISIFLFVSLFPSFFLFLFLSLFHKNRRLRSAWNGDQVVLARALTGVFRGNEIKMTAKCSLPNR